MNDFDDFYSDEERGNYISPNFEPPKYDGQNKDSYNYLTDTTNDYDNYDYSTNEYNQPDNKSNDKQNNEQDSNKNRYYTDTAYNTPNKQQNYGGYNQNTSNGYNNMESGKNKKLLFILIGFFVVAAIILIAALLSVFYTYFNTKNSSSGNSGVSSNKIASTEVETETQAIAVYDINDAFDGIGSFDASRLEACLASGNFDIDYYDEDNYPLLLYAILSGNNEAVEILIKGGADINLKDSYNNQESIIHYTVYGGNLEALELLIEYGADVNIANSSGATPLLYSPLSGIEFVDLLVGAGADVMVVDMYGWNAMLYCAYYGDEEMYDYFLELGADENALSSKGYNVTHVALRGGNIDLVQKLIDKGYELSQPTINGDTLLHIVNNAKMAEYVMANYECDYNAKNSDGDTPLHYAAYNELRIDIVKEFLANGANLNVQNNYGSTPLMYAVPNAELVEFLLDNGADKTIMDQDGDTAYDYIELQDDIDENVKEELESLLIIEP